VGFHPIDCGGCWGDWNQAVRVVAARDRLEPEHVPRGWRAGSGWSSRPRPTAQLVAGLTRKDESAAEGPDAARGGTTTPWWTGADKAAADDEGAHVPGLSPLRLAALGPS